MINMSCLRSLLVVILFASAATTVSAAVTVIDNTDQDDNFLPCNVSSATQNYQAFTTASDLGPFSVESISVNITSSAAASLTATVYSVSDSSLVSEWSDSINVGILATGTNVTFSLSPSDLSLDEGTEYFLRLTSPSPDTVQWIACQSTSGGSFGWTIGSLYYGSDNPSTWGEDSDDLQMFAITVTAVPEPSSYAAALGLLALAGACTRRRIRK